MPNNYPPNFVWHYERYTSFDTGYPKELLPWQLEMWKRAYVRLKQKHPVDAMIMHIWLSKPGGRGYRTSAEMAQLLGYSRGGMHGRLLRAWRRFTTQVFICMRADRSANEK